jgi:antitoxin component of MazEF toxin-antitoxin module
MFTFRKKFTGSHICTREGKKVHFSVENGKRFVFKRADAFDQTKKLDVERKKIKLENLISEIHRQAK